MADPEANNPSPAETSGVAPPDREQLEQERHRLRALVSSFEMLNSSLDLDTVLSRTLEQAVSLMNAELGSIALLNEEKTHLIFVQSTDPNFSRLKQMKIPVERGIAGHVARTGESVRVEDAKNDHRFYSDIDKRLDHVTRTYLCVPLIVNNGIIGTAQLMNKMDGTLFTPQDEGLFSGFGRQAALAIQNAKLHQVMMKQQAMDSELRVCNEIQTNLYPKRIPDFPGYELFGQTIPCREVGGDYYSYVPRPDGSMDVVIADVSGKGVSAAMLVSEIHTGIQLLSRMDYSLARTVEHLNNHLLDTIITGKFITFFIARLFPQTNQVEYINAGHPPPFLIQHNGVMEELQTTGPILGFKSISMQSIWIEMAPGDLLVSFSDAYSESQDGRGNLFGEERIGKLAREHRHESLESIAEIIQTEAREFRNDHPADDDATLLFFRKTNNNQEQGVHGN